MQPNHRDGDYWDDYRRDERAEQGPKAAGDWMPPRPDERVETGFSPKLGKLVEPDERQLDLLGGAR